MFELANPWSLVLLLLPLLIWILLSPAKVIISSALTVPFYKPLLKHLNQNQHYLATSSQVGLFLIIWSLIVIALAGPRWVGEPILLTRDGHNIMLVLDLSGSMELDDMLLDNQPSTRLSVVKKAAKEFVNERAGDSIGLILFGTKAYLQTPLTFDRHNVLLRIDDATVGLAGKTTSIGDALGLAVKRLGDVSAKSRIVILLTDGASNSGVLTPLKAAQLAKDEHIKVYTIGLGSETPLVNNPFFTMNGSDFLDEKTLQKIANLTNGHYFRATDSKSLQQIYKTIHQLETISQDAGMVRPQQEYYPWPLAAAWLLISYWWISQMHFSRSFLSSNRYVKG
jgi:Ca-activated chloride channel family protein